MTIVMTGAKSGLSSKPTLGTQRDAKCLQRAFKDPDDSFKIVIVRDMWLAGFEVLPPTSCMSINRSEGTADVRSRTTQRAAAKDRQAVDQDEGRGIEAL